VGLDERITANEWNKRRECPICKDIADGNIDLEGELVVDDKSGEAIPCPMCTHADTRIFHSIGGVESQKSSSRGDTQVWNHLITVKCMSCTFKHVVANNICLGEPWDEVFGFKRKLDQHAQQEHAIKWSNEEAVGLRGSHAKYSKDTELLGRGYRAQRKIETKRSQDGTSKVEWKPSKEEKKLPKFKQD
jgi:hypothetical protein